MAAPTEKPAYRADTEKLRNLPEYLQAFPYFCLWKWEWDKKASQWKKVPYDPRTGRKAQSNNRATFAPLDTALGAYQRGGFDGLGIGLFDGMSGIDIDHHMRDGRMDDFASAIVDGMDSYTEVSPSGKGVHILFSCPSFSATFDRKGYTQAYMFNSRKLGLETYVSGITNRFLTITGNTISTGTSGDKSEPLRQMLDRHMRRGSRNTAPQPKTATNKTTNRTDAQLLKKAKSAKNGDLFTRLWDGDTTGYGSHSEADQALCNLLAYWWAKDEDAIDRMFRQSGLYREKWEREDYRTATIDKAIADTRNVYDPASARVNRQSSDVIHVNAEVIEANISKLDGIAVGDVERGIVESGIAGQEINDLNLGRAFARCYRSRLRYVAEAEAFYCYDGVRWVPDTKSMQRANKLAKAFIDTLLICAVRLVSAENRKQYIQELMQYTSHNRRIGLLKDAASELLCGIGEFDSNLNLFNVLNGTLDLTTYELRPHDSSDMITKVAPVTYNPEATCPDWERFLLESLEGDVDTIAYIQQQLGVSMAGDTSQEHMHILLGPTRSGKSTTLQVVQTLLGSYACGVSPATITKQKRSGQNASGDIARLEGVRFAVIPEPQQGMELSAETVKMLTGNDVVTARHLYQGERDFRPVVNLWVATNHMPQIDDPTVLESDRIVVIPFNRHLPKEQRDMGLKDRLCRDESLSGVLNWLLKGLSDFHTECAPVPDGMQKLTDEFRDQADRVRVFVSEELVKDEESYLPAVTVYKAYIAWAEAGNADPNKGKQSFFADLRRLNVLRDRFKKLRNVVAGYRLANHIAA